MTRDDTEIVSALRAAVADRVGKERFDLWFGATSRLELDATTLTVVVPNEFFQQWLRANFCGHLQAACLETLGRLPLLEFRVDPGLTAATVGGAGVGDASQTAAQPGSRIARGAAAGPGLPRPGAAGPSKGLRLMEGGQPVHATPSPKACSPFETSPAGPPHTSQVNGAGRRRFADLESFALGPSNRLAHAAAETVVQRPGELSPLLVHGPTGVGKTHLLEGVWTGLRRRHPRLATIYLSAEQFTTGFVEALRGGGLPSFRRKYRGLDVLILDDLHFFAGKRSTKVELQYTVDTLLREGRQLVFAADRPPSELSDLGPELISRLASGIVCRIEPPDFQTRLEILARMAHRLGLRLPDDVSRYVASHLANHARELSGALCRLRATSQSLGQPVTLEMAEESLADLVRASKRAVRLPDIERAVCEAFGLEPELLHASGKAKAASHPRMLAMWLARRYTRNSLSEISSYFGRRSHTTVLAAQKRVDLWLAGGKSIDLADRTWKIGDAIEQVERRLRAC